MRALLRAVALLLLLSAVRCAPPPSPALPPPPTPAPPLLLLRNACASPAAHARAAAAARALYPEPDILSYEETCLAGWGARVPRALARLARSLRWRRVLLRPPHNCRAASTAAAAAAPVALALQAAGLAVAWSTDDDTPLQPDAVVTFVCGEDPLTPEDTKTAAGGAGAAGVAPLLLLLRVAELPAPPPALQLDSLLPYEREENYTLSPGPSWPDSSWNESEPSAGAAWSVLGAVYEARREGGWRLAAELLARGGEVRLRGEGALQAQAGVAPGGGEEAAGEEAAAAVPLLLLTPLPALVVLVLAGLALRAWRRRRRVRGSVQLPVEHFQFPAEAEDARRVGEGMESMLSCWLQQLHEFGGPPLAHGPLPRQPSQPSSACSAARLAGAGAGATAASGVRYRGEAVLLHPLPRPPAGAALELRARATDVLLVMQSLHHENLNAFIGCLGGVRPALAWAWGARGSLEDVLVADDIRLDWPFRLSLLTDLVRGARRLHASPLRAHGRLSSRACVVDARWVLRITDYGLPSFYRAQGLPEPPRTARDLLWTAPELLREARAGADCGTPAGDVFSFAIIMQEVIVRGEPYCMLPLAAEEIVEKLCRPPPLIRPSVSMGAAPPEAVSVMRQCWSEAPDLRPDFASLLEIFRHLHRGRKINIVDSMFEMLEKYSNNLEELIRERTEQLDMEKRKTEQLLNRMLPRQVAERLLLGSPVEPEEFADVSVYFSDIVGFTALAAASTPVQVVDLLNELYTRFDAVIELHGVYKVETIGDAYMVVGGLPERCGDHAERVATVALLLQREAARVRVRHLLPARPLLLRAGMHTGAVCAGVVGRTMPRYCLFGDTVNTAARMESTGAARRVQLSQASARRLQAAGGFRLRSRGLTHVKGKGRMHTYWLLGKDDLDGLDGPDGPNVPDEPPLDEDEPEPPSRDPSPVPAASAPPSPGDTTPLPRKPNTVNWQRAGTQSADSSPVHAVTPAPAPAAPPDPSAPYARYRCGAGARVLRRQWSLERPEPPHAPPPAARYRTRAEPP